MAEPPLPVMWRAGILWVLFVVVNKKNKKNCCWLEWNTNTLRIFPMYQDGRSIAHFTLLLLIVRLLLWWLSIICNASSSKNRIDLMHVRRTYRFDHSSFGNGLISEAFHEYTFAEFCTGIPVFLIRVREGQSAFWEASSQRTLWWIFFLDQWNQRGRIVWF